MLAHTLAVDNPDAQTTWQVANLLTSSHRTLEGELLCM